MKELIIIIISYLAGCFNTGYYFTRFIYHKDIRTVGTNVTGAVNVSRIAGKKGFVITFLGDAVKGALVVFTCRLFFVNTSFTLLCILLVIVGHIFPIQLRFRGGKGISTAFGAFLVWNPLIILGLMLLCAVLLPVVHRYTVACILSLIVLPFILLILYNSVIMTGFFLLDAVVINYACRSNLIEFLTE